MTRVVKVLEGMVNKALIDGPMKMNLTRAAKVTKVWSLVPCKMTRVVKVLEGMVNEALIGGPTKMNLEQLQEDEGGKGYQSMELGNGRNTLARLK